MKDAEFAYFLEVKDRHGELVFRRAFSSEGKRWAALAKWCEMEPSDVDGVRSFFFYSRDYSYHCWQQEIE